MIAINGHMSSRVHLPLLTCSHFVPCRVPFWRFLVTGADQNQELKMWCTVSWSCLQTIKYVNRSFNITQS